MAADVDPPRLLVSAALDWYARLLKVAPRRKDTTVQQLVLYAMRASSLSTQERAAILADLAAIQSGRVSCPECGAPGGEHTVHGHHRFYKIAFTCARCGVRFTATQINHNQ